MPAAAPGCRCAGACTTTATTGRILAPKASGASSAGCERPLPRARPRVARARVDESRRDLLDRAAHGLRSPRHRRALAKILERARELRDEPAPRRAQALRARHVSVP